MVQNLRYNIIIIITYAVGIILLIQLFNLQIVHGGEYRQTSNTRLTRETTLKAARGDITDATGNKLVTTKTGFSLQIYKTKIDNQTLNKSILNIIHLLEKNKDKYIDNLPIKVNPYEFLIETEEEQKEWKQENDINENATAEEAFNKLKEEYEIQENDINKARKIMVVRYEISENGFSNIKPVTIAKNISNLSVNQIRELSGILPGAAVITEPILEYPYGTLASHILGYVAAISPEEYEEKSETYDINDVIGKTGIEYTLEEYLKGKDGIRQIDMSVDGTITEEYISQEAEAGCNVALTIDANLQKVTEKALENNIKKIANGEYGGENDANAGAAIVMNIKTGEILSLASYPNYEPELFIEGISEKKLKEYNENSNLFNRAISGTYAPGSTFKMVVATAALEKNVINTNTVINDIGVYPRGYNPACWIYNDRGYGHGFLNITDAIKKSCNYFFYELGYKMGIDPVIEYAKAYGLGTKTGIELLGELNGIVDVKKQCEEETEEQWQFGDTLSAVIGQSYNSYTPIQMARYISILTNGQKVVNPTLIRSVIKADGTEIPKDELNKFVNEKLGLTENTEEQLNIKPENVQAILEGMKSVTDETGGTAHSVFRNFNIEVGGKTGSTESNTGDINAWFTGFAPYNDPEIAVVVLVENGGHGYYTAEVVRDIIGEYFGMNMNGVKEDMTATGYVEEIR